MNLIPAAMQLTDLDEIMVIESTIVEGSMDIVFLAAAALMFAALIGMVLGCDRLGVRK